MLLVLVPGLGVPEGDGGVLSVRLGVGVHHRVGKVGPLISSHNNELISGGVE